MTFSPDRWLRILVSTPDRSVRGSSYERKMYSPLTPTISSVLNGSQWISQAPSVFWSQGYKKGDGSRNR